MRTVLQKEIDENGKKVWIGAFSKMGARRTILNLRHILRAATFESPIQLDNDTGMDVAALKRKAKRIQYRNMRSYFEYGWMFFYETSHVEIADELVCWWEPAPVGKINSG